MTVFLRNRHPRRALAIPCNGHWCRVLPAGATSTLPDATLRHPVTRLLMAKQLITVVDAAQYDADARQERAGRIDSAELARQAEQKEFDRLLAGVKRQLRVAKTGRANRASRAQMNGPRHRWRC